MRSTVEFNFRLNQKVLVYEDKEPAIVVGLMTYMYGPQVCKEVLVEFDGRGPNKHRTWCLESSISEN